MLMPVYKHTKKYDYLQTARRIAKYFITNLPDDGVVPWYVPMLHIL